MGVAKAKAKAKSKQSGEDRAKLPVPAAVVGLLNRFQVCDALGGISLRKFNAMISAGTFPRNDTWVGQSPRWSVALVNGWCEDARANPQKPTPATGQFRGAGRED